MTCKHLLLTMLLGAPAATFAAAPDLQNTGPIIFLADNLDEADGLGYCIDTKGRGLTEGIQLHSCKPDSNNSQNRDVLFRMNRETGRIEHAEYAGYCITLNDENAATDLGLYACGDSDAQQFTYDPGTGEIHPGGDRILCLVGNAESNTAGPFMSRTLDVHACSDADPALKTFVVQE